MYFQIVRGKRNDGKIITFSHLKFKRREVPIINIFNEMNED